LVAHTFSSVIRPLVTFLEIFFFKGHSSVILVLMTPVLSF
jgi:ABC-type transport system involved in cytochrome bd biosynthesis fused ATPase/permease subunit